MEDNYLKAYKEVIEILNFVPKESVDKIPKTLINTFKAKMDKNHDFKVDINKSFEEQKLLDETKAIFANIFRDYWATPHQKEIIKLKEKNDKQKIEEEKAAKYNINVFNKREVEKEAINNLKEQEINNLPIEIKKEKFYQKIKKILKKYFM